MDMQLTARSTATIHAPVSKVWQALTDSALIKQYLFGVEAISDWKEGSPIVYRGMWEGKPFEDKGNILKMEPQKRLLCNYWSSFSGLPDRPENYQNVSYELTPENDHTRVTITQDKIATPESKQHTEQNWNLVLANLKKLLE